MCVEFGFSEAHRSAKLLLIVLILMVLFWLCKNHALIAWKKPIWSHGYESNHFSMRMCKYFYDSLRAARRCILPSCMFSVLYVVDFCAAQETITCECLSFRCFSRMHRL